MKPGPKAVDPTIRFWKKVDRRGRDECWPWLGGLQGRGYGQFMLRKGTLVGAHRYSWMLANGADIPMGMHVMHSCDNPPCVNPDHLSIGTCADNRRDCAAKGRNPGNRTGKGKPVGRHDPRVVHELRLQGMSYRQIGDLLGCSASTALRTHRRL